MASTPITPRIVSFYEDGDLDVLFDGVESTYERLHVSAFQTRKNIILTQAIELAMELPRGAFIAGGFVKSIMHGVSPKDYDLFFNSAESLLSLVRRIHSATEGSFLHGYECDKSLRNFADSEDVFINFVHPTKPALQLNRIRWFSRPEEALDKFDFRMSQFALDADLNMVFSVNGLTDARDKRLYMVKVVFPLSTSLRLKRYLDAGWVWVNGNYDSYWRDDYVRKAADYIRKTNKTLALSGKPAIENVEGFGSYLL